MEKSWWALLQGYPRPGQLFLLVFILATGLTGILYKLAITRRLLPGIRSRDIHTVRKPRIGGVAMWFAIVTGLLVVATGWSTNDALNFNRAHYFGLDISLWGILLGLIVILVVGLIDDIRDLTPTAQLAGQCVAALFLVFAGIGVPTFHVPFIDHTIVLGLFWSRLFTVLWVMTMMNVMNFFDGLDGLAGSVSMTAAAVLLLVSLRTGFLATATLSLVVMAATAGFLPWNWHPSRIFMGTVGSQMLGFLLGVIAIISGGKVATAVLVLGIPFLDAIFVIVRRLIARQSPFKADQRHLHHRLLKTGLSIPAVVLLIDGVSVIFGVLAFQSQATNGKAFLTLTLFVCMLLFIGVTFLLEQRPKKPVH